MGLFPKKKKIIGTLVKECCDKIPFFNIGRFHDGFIFSLSGSMCKCMWFFKSDDCTVKEEGKKKVEKKGEFGFVNDPYNFQLIYRKRLFSNITWKLKN